jgi:peptidoglycan/LPS O-acetylase OafA/YrhL
MTLESNSAGRLKELDSLRGLAALGVLLFHYTGHYERLYHHTPPLAYGFDAGNYGVHLFFMISGFVIFMTLERTRTALDFVVSRFSRLFPAFWVALLCTYIIVALAGLEGQRVSAKDALINVSMMPDIFNAQEVDGSYWTLQVELFFYVQMLIWFVLGALPRIRLVICAWLLLAASYGLLTQMGFNFSYLLREVTIVRFIPFFAAGILMYRIHHRRDPLWQNVLLLGGCGAAAWCVWSWELAAVMAVCCSVFGLFVAGKLRFLSSQPFLFFGAISYSLYLLHQNIGYIVISWLEHEGAHFALAIGATIAIMVVLAWLMAKFVERPALHFIRKSYKHWRDRGNLHTAGGSA